MKKLKDLTSKEAEKIIKTYYPDHCFMELIHEPIRGEHGIQISLSGNVVGIKTIAGINNDGCLIPFHDLKVIKWLYNNEYDINELLEQRIAYCEDSEEWENTLSNYLSESYFIAKNTSYSPEVRLNLIIERHNSVLNGN